MVIYNLQWTSSALKDLKRLDKSVLGKVLDRADTLKENPFPPGVRKLQGSLEGYRIRLGEYRIVYRVESDVLIVLIVRVRHRGDVYK